MFSIMYTDLQIEIFTKFSTAQSINTYLNAIKSPYTNNKF